MGVGAPTPRTGGACIPDTIRRVLLALGAPACTPSHCSQPQLPAGRPNSHCRPGPTKAPCPPPPPDTCPPLGCWSQEPGGTPARTPTRPLLPSRPLTTPRTQASHFCCSPSTRHAPPVCGCSTLHGRWGPSGPRHPLAQHLSPGAPSLSQEPCAPPCTVAPVGPGPSLLPCWAPHSALTTTGPEAAAPGGPLLPLSRNPRFPHWTGVQGHPPAQTLRARVM